MPKATSTLAHSKTYENQVQRFLWPGSSRPWEKRWDVAGPDPYDGPWFGEVKCRAGLSFAAGIRLAVEAAQQLIEATADRKQPRGLFVVIHQKGTTMARDAVFMVKKNGLELMTLEQFREITRE